MRYEVFISTMTQQPPEKRNGHLPRKAGACPVKRDPNEQNIQERNTKNKVQEGEGKKSDKLKRKKLHVAQTF
jgi:hypothetical protein